MPQLYFGSSVQALHCCCGCNIKSGPLLKRLFVGKEQHDDGKNLRITINFIKTNVIRLSQKIKNIHRSKSQQ